MVPLLTLGLPGSGTTAVMLGALMMFGLKPGPLLIQDNPGLFWGLIASMYIGNAVLLVLNLPLVGLFARMLDLSREVLLPMILAFSFLGVWAANTSTYDVVMLAAFGVVGYAMRLLDFPAAPLLLSLVLGDLMEQALRQSLTMFDGNPVLFLSRPITLGLLILSVLSIAAPMLRRARQQRRSAGM